MEATVCLHLAKVLCLLNKAASFSCYLAKLKIKTDKTNWDKCEMITFPRLLAKLYIPSNIKTILMLWHMKTKKDTYSSKIAEISTPLAKGPNLQSTQRRQKYKIYFSFYGTWDISVLEFMQTIAKLIFRRDIFAISLGFYHCF